MTEFAPQSGQSSDLMAALSNLQASGPMLTVSSSPLFDAIIALFRFSKEQAMRQNEENGAMKREMSELREMVERTRQSITTLEEKKQPPSSRPEELEEIRREVERVERSTAARQLEQDSVNQECIRKIQKVQNDVSNLKDDISGLAKASAVEELVGNELQKTRQDLSHQIDGLRTQVSGQLKEVAQTVSQVDQNCNRFDQQSQTRDRTFEQDLRKAQDEIKLLLDRPTPPQQVVVQQPTQQLPSNNSGHLTEAFHALKDRLLDLEDTRDEQGKAAVVITQYFDKLDHLYSVLELDKRSAAMAASQGVEEKVTLLHSLPAFKSLKRLIQQIPSALPQQPVRAVPGHHHRRISPSRGRDNVIHVTAAGVDISDQKGPNGGGITVVDVTPGGPASDAGWQPGDHLVGIFGNPLTGGAQDFAAAISRSSLSSVPVTRIPVGHYRPVSGNVNFSTRSTTPIRERSWH